MNASSVRLLIVGDSKSAVRSVDQLGVSLGGLHRSAGLASAGLLSLAVGGIGAAVKSAGDLERDLNVLQVTTGATARQMAAMREQAVALGRDAKLPATSARDAAKAMLELARGGLSVRDTMSATRGVLQLSAAAQIDNARAAQITADALNAFGLAGTQATHVADLLANAANVSTGTVDDMALALQQVAGVAHLTGASLEDTATAITLMANAGVKGQDAGTSLKTMLMRLEAPTRQVSDELARLGLHLFDAEGRFVGLRSMVEQIGPKLAGMTQQQRASTLAILGSTDAARAIGFVLGSNLAKWDATEAKVTAAGGAAKLAEAQTKGFNGALEAAKSEASTLATSLGTLLLPKLTEGLKAATGWVTAYDESGRAQEDFNAAVRVGGEVLHDAKVVLDDVVPAAKDLAHTADEIAQKVGGWGTAFELILGGKLAASFLGLAGAGGIGAAGAAAGGLEATLLRLVARAWVVPVTLLISESLQKKTDEKVAKAMTVLNPLSQIGQGSRDGMVYRDYTSGLLKRQVGSQGGVARFETVKPTPGLVYSDNGRLMQVPGGESFDFSALNSLVTGGIASSRGRGAGRVNRAAGFTGSDSFLGSGGAVAAARGAAGAAAAGGSSGGSADTWQPVEVPASLAAMKKGLDDLLAEIRKQIQAQQEINVDLLSQRLETGQGFTRQFGPLSTTSPEMNAQLRRNTDVSWLAGKLGPAAKQLQAVFAFGAIDHQTLAAGQAKVAKAKATITAAFKDGLITPGELQKIKGQVADITQASVDATKSLATYTQTVVEQMKTKFEAQWSHLADLALQAFDAETAKKVKATTVHIEGLFQGEFRKFDFWEGAKTPSEQLLETEDSEQAKADREAALAKATQAVEEEQARIAELRKQGYQENSQEVVEVTKQLAEAEKQKQDALRAITRAGLEARAGQERAAADAALAKKQQDVTTERQIERDAFATAMEQLKVDLAAGKVTKAEAMQKTVDLLAGYGVDFKTAGGDLGEKFSGAMDSALEAMSTAAGNIAKAVAALVLVMGGKVGDAKKLLDELLGVKQAIEKTYGEISGGGSSHDTAPQPYVPPTDPGPVTSPGYGVGPGYGIDKPVPPEILNPLLPYLGGYADGGWITRKGIYLGGENEPELVIPRSRLEAVAGRASISRGAHGNAAPPVIVELHGDLAALDPAIDARVRHPGNVDHVAYAIGSDADKRRREGRY